MGEKFCAYFGVSLDQLCGEAEIDGLFPDRNYTYTRPAPGVVKLDVARGNHGDMAEIARIREHLTDAAKIKAVMSLGEKLTAKDSAKLAQYFLARAVAGL